MPDFTPWPKTPRLFSSSPAAREDNAAQFMIITEKIDGTNSAVLIEPALYHSPDPDRDSWSPIYEPVVATVYDDEKHEAWHVYAQSRKRFITPSSDNFGFAAWVKAHAPTLVELLGEGRHFGEWWGKGIQRGYDKLGREFSLFNVQRYAPVAEDFRASIIGLNVVPTLKTSALFDTQEVRDTLEELRTHGSMASGGFMNPEGVVVYHRGLNGTFKAFVSDL